VHHLHPYIDEAVVVDLDGVAAEQQAQESGGEQGAQADRGQVVGLCGVQVCSIPQPAGEAGVADGDELVDGEFDEFGSGACFDQHNAQQIGLAVEFGQGIAAQQGQFDPQEPFSFLTAREAGELRKAKSPRNSVCASVWE